jgi:hypothetical protein
MKTPRSLSLGMLVLFCAASAPAQLVTGRLATSFYGWEQFDTVGVSHQRVRAFQNVQLSMTQGDLSVNTFIQGATNLAGDFGDIGRVRFYNLYLTWAKIGDVLDLNVGRQAVYAGAGVGTIDGLLARARFLQQKVTVTGFAGSTVAPEFAGVRKNLHDNYHFGGQVVTTIVPDARIGLSYMNRREERDPYWTVRTRDTLFAPVTYFIANDSPAEELGSAEAMYEYANRFSVYGRYDHDFANARASRAQGGARVYVTEALALTADYVHRVPRVSYNSIFSAFVANAVDEIEGGVEYGFTPMVRAFARVAQVRYTDEQSTRWSVGVNNGYGSFAYSGSDGYAGELQSVSFQGSYPLFGRTVIPTAGISYASYRLSKESTRDNALSVLLGAVVRPARAFSFDVQAQWLTNKISQRDLRLQLKLMYWFAERLSIFKGEGKQ